MFSVLVALLRHLQYLFVLFPLDLACNTGHVLLPYICGSLPWIFYSVCYYIIVKKSRMKPVVFIVGNLDPWFQTVPRGIYVNISLNWGRCTMATSIVDRKGERGSFGG